MALHGCGLLIGKITGFRKPRGRHPHWLLMVQPANPHHPTYRVALNVPDVQPRDGSEIEYQIADFKPDHPLISKLRRYKTRGSDDTPSFLLADEDRSVPRLSYEKGDVVDPSGFPSEAKNEPKVGSQSPPQDLKLLQVSLK